MKFGELNINIKDYLGRIGPGVVVVLSILYKTKIYEGMLWYTDEFKILEVGDFIESEVGKIEEYSEYENIIKHLTELIPEYKEIAPKLEDIFEENPTPEKDHPE